MNRKHAQVWPRRRPRSPPASASAAPIALTIEFAADVNNPTDWVSAPRGWSIEGDKPGRKFAVRQSSGPPSSGKSVTINRGAPGFESGLILHLTVLPTTGATRIANGTTLQGESSIDPKALQESVSNGHQPWRIVPQEVAMEYLDKQGQTVGALTPEAIQLSPQELRLVLADPGTGRRFEVILQRADSKSDQPAWIVIRCVVSP